MDLQYDRIIRPKRGLIGIDFRELWDYRELFWFFGWREVTVRYKQTMLGILWAVVQPVLTMIVFTFIFGRLAGFDKGTDTPYAMITLSGVVVWQFFSEVLSKSGESLVAQSNLITKVYFPRLVVPATYLIAGTVDFLIAMVILLIMMACYGLAPSPTFLLLPLFFLMAAMAAFGMGLWLCALNVKYRDVKYIIPFIVRLGIYISPVGFLSSVIKPEYRFWYSLNPMVGAIDGFRWCILGPAFAPYWLGFWVSTAVVVVLLVTGAYYFRSVEKTFADVI
ncbi:MAG TPA: ABC transporter permease [Candidatus Paceibacterota bacterium]|nr:ABC transporter permease [Verrucomicrobiota bacterium]HSA12731.1 ABC transporter permease [Candidatus Paceibacterota bacterium]